MPEARQLDNVAEALPAIECETAQSADATPPEPMRPAIEVTLPNGTVVRVDGAADAKALRAVFGALVDR